MLLDAGAKVDEVNNAGQTPAHLAAKNGHHASLSQIIEAGANTSVKVRSRQRFLARQFLLCISYAHCFRSATLKRL